MAGVSGPTPFNANTVTAPGYDAFAITTSDTVNFGSMCRGIYVGVGGDIVVVTSQGTVVTFKSVPQGVILPVMAIRVNATGTTATNLVGLI